MSLEDCDAKWKAAKTMYAAADELKTASQGDGKILMLIDSEGNATEVCADRC